MRPEQTRKSWRLRRCAGIATALGAVTFGALVGTTGAAHALTICKAPCTNAVDDDFTTTFTTAGTAFTVAAPGVLANDEGPPNTVVSVADSDTTSYAGATITMHADGSFIYKPDPKNPFTGDDFFFYTIQHGPNDSSDGTVNIHVKPVVRDDTYYAKGGTTLNVDAAHGVLANDLGVTPPIDSADATSAHGAQVNVNDAGDFSYTPNAGFSGPDTFTYAISDIDGDHSYTATVHILVDPVSPIAWLTQPTGAVTASTNVAVKWTGVDLGSNASGIRSYTVDVRRAPWNGRLGSWAAWKSHTTATGATYVGGLGETDCFRVSAVDRAGNASSWSPEKCTTVPLHAGSFVYSSGWRKSVRTDVYGGYEFLSTTKGAKATRTGLRGSKLFIVATKCATCGTAQVRWNNVVIANVNLSHSTTLRKQVVGVKSLSSAQTGTLTVIVTSSGKPVILEGFAAWDGAA